MHKIELSLNLAAVVQGNDSDLPLLHTGTLHLFGSYMQTAEFLGSCSEVLRLVWKSFSLEI